MKRHANNAVLAILVLALSMGVAWGKQASLTQAEVKDGWILLFDGESMFGLTQEGPWRVTEDGSLLADGPGAGYIRTNSAFSNFVLKMDVRVANSAADAALYIRTAKDANPTDNGYQIRIGDGPNWPAGSIVPKFKGNAGHPQAGQWHTLEVNAEGDHITVLIDQKTAADGKDRSSHSGYIGIKVGAGTKLEVRNFKLKLLNTVAVFNGNDLTGWKLVIPQPKVEKQNPLSKLIPPPLRPGKPSVKESMWSVNAAKIHGEKGPGQLETAAVYDDFVLQFTVPPSPKKSENHHTIYVRGDPGKVFTGYEIVMDADRPGAIAPKLAVPRKIVSIADLAIGTVALIGRHLEVWVNGFPVTEFTDTRPEGASTAQNARTSAGAIGLPLHDSKANADYTLVLVTSIARPLGGVMGKPLPSPTPVVADTPASSVPAKSLEDRRQEIKDRKIALLLKEARETKDLEKKRSKCNQALIVDPNNANANQCFNEAQAKIDVESADKTKVAADDKVKQENEKKAKAAINAATAAFLVGNLGEAERQLHIAEVLAPDSSDVQKAVQELRPKISAGRAQQRRNNYFLFGGGVLAVGGISSLFFFQLRKKQGFLQVVSGVDNGRRYDLDGEVVRIGAVAEDSGAKNDIVVRDVEHMVSRFHCEIHREKGKFYLVDCNSANGTRIDRRSIPPEQFARLRNGSRIELGSTVTLLFGLERKRRNRSSDRQFARQASSR